MIDPAPFSTPQHQSLIGVLVFLLRNGRIIFSLGIAAFAVGNNAPNAMMYVVGGLGAGILLTAVISYLQYRNFTFHVHQGELIIHRGVIVKDRKSIPLSRIQSVHIEQNIIQQALGVVGLKIDSAGSTGKELEIAALKKPVAYAFRDVLKQNVVMQDKPGAPAEMPEKEDTHKVLVALSPIDLLKVGLTENHVRNGIVAILVVYGYITQYLDFAQEYVESYVAEYMADVPGQLVRAGLALILAMVVAFILVSVLISLGRTVLKFYQFRAAISEDVVEISSGLLKKQEIRIPVHKIQYLRWESNPLRKKLGFETVSVFQVQPGREQKKTRVEIPACYPDQTTSLEKLVYDEQVPRPDSSVHADKWAYTRFYTMIFGLPLLIWTFIQYQIYPIFWYLPLLVLPVIIFFAYQYGKSVRLTFFNEYMMIRKGWIFPRRTILSYYKGQAFRFSDNVFIRRRQLAHLTLHTASGKVNIRYLPAGLVKKIVSYSLRKAETTQRSWM